MADKGENLGVLSGISFTVKAKIPRFHLACAMSYIAELYWQFQHLPTSECFVTGEDVRVHQRYKLGWVPV